MSSHKLSPKMCSILLMKGWVSFKPSFIITISITTVIIIKLSWTPCDTMTLLPTHRINFPRSTNTVYMF